MLILLPLTSAVLALGCAAFMGRDALRRPRPELSTWTLAFLVFAVAAGSEVAGSAFGWTTLLARLYYLTGAVLVVGLLALGELYLLAPERLPAITPGVALLVTAVAATAVWSAPVDVALLTSEGWNAIERGPFLVALAASINAGGTLVLVGGTLYSAWALRRVNGMQSRAAGCLLIAVGAVVVAAGGTLTRFGHREYLYLAMSSGIAVIFAGIMLTRRHTRSGQQVARHAPPTRHIEPGPRLVSLPVKGRQEPSATEGAGVRYIVESLLPLDDAALQAACLRWSAGEHDGIRLSREEARQVWSLRLALPSEATGRFDRLPLAVQAQLAELYAEVWTAERSVTGAQQA